MRRALFLVLLGFGLAGCISKVSGIEGGEADIPWRIGETTRRDVVSKWGNPEAIRGRTWVWKGLRGIGGKVKVGYMMVGLSVSNVESSTVICELTFGEDGRLEKKSLIDSIVRRPEWSADPF